MPKDKGNNNRNPAGSDIVWDVVERVLPYLDDLLAVLAGSLGLLTILGLLRLTSGALISPWVDLLEVWLGLGAWAVPVLLSFIAFALARRSLGRPVQIPWLVR